MMLQLKPSSMSTIPLHPIQQQSKVTSLVETPTPSAGAAPVGRVRGPVAACRPDHWHR